MVTRLKLPEAAGPGTGNLFNGPQGSLGLLGCLSHLVEPHFSWGSKHVPKLALESAIVCAIDLQAIQNELGALLHAKGVHDTELKDGRLSSSFHGSFLIHNHFPVQYTVKANQKQCST